MDADDKALSLYDYIDAHLCEHPECTSEARFQVFIGGMLDERFFCLEHGLNREH